MESNYVSATTRTISAKEKKSFLPNTSRRGIILMFFFPEDLEVRYNRK